MDQPAVRSMTPPEIERVAAELEIRNLLARVAQLADTGDTAEYLGLPLATMNVRHFPMFRGLRAPY